MEHKKIKILKLEDKEVTIIGIQLIIVLTHLLLLFEKKRVFSVFTGTIL